MAITEYKRIINKSGSGVPTIPPSPSHDNGDWIETDIYDGEFYMDTDTGKVYTANNGVIVEVMPDLPAATETVAGIAEIATNAETVAGVDDARIVTPLKLKNWWTNLKAGVAQFIASEWTFEDLKVQALGALFKTKIASGASSNQTWTIPAEGDQEFASRAYVDNLSAGLKWKTQVVAATTANGTLATDFEDGDTLDGVLLATGDRILLKDQTAAEENGIYIVQASGAPVRSTDADTGDELISCAVFVKMGTVNADRAFVCTSDSITIGVDPVVFTGFASVIGSLIAANNLSDVVSASTAFDNIKQTASETTSGVAEIATAAEVITGTDPVRMVVPARLADWWANIKSSAQSITGVWGFTSEKVKINNGATAATFKADATTNQTWTIPDEGSQTFASRAYADGKVADAINDGTTTIAPSQNAVYDALYKHETEWKILSFAPAFHIAANVTAADVYWHNALGQASFRQNVAVSNPPVFNYLKSSDYTSSIGLTPKLRIKISLMSVNDVAPARTLVVGLYPCSGPSSGTTGGAGVRAYASGTVVTGSTVTFTTPAADAFTTDQYSSTFDFPADGLYAIGCSINGALAANSGVHIIAELQVHYE